MDEEVRFPQLIGDISRALMSQTSALDTNFTSIAIFCLCTVGLIKFIFNKVVYSQESIDDILFSHSCGVRKPANFPIVCSGIL